MGKLRNVLYAYTRRNPTVGYCQGLNFIAATLLRFLEEEETFWTLTMLIECILPIDYYSVMVGVLLDQKIFQYYIKKYLPSLFQHFQKIGMDPSLFSLQWFVCLFSYNLPFVVIYFILLF